MKSLRSRVQQGLASSGMIDHISFEMTLMQPSEESTA